MIGLRVLSEPVSVQGNCRKNMSSTLARRFTGSCFAGGCGPQSPAGMRQSDVLVSLESASLPVAGPHLDNFMASGMPGHATFLVVFNRCMVACVPMSRWGCLWLFVQNTEK